MQRPFTTIAWIAALLSTAISASAAAASGVVVIGHATVAGLDAATLERVYTGKAIEVNGVRVIAVNAVTGSDVRSRFLQAYLRQDDDRYAAYWVVRRYIGKGAPPLELPTSVEMIRYVNSTPGAIGYISESDVKPGLNILLK